MLTYENEYLFRIQEQSLFLYTLLFFKLCMSEVGGLLIWLGCYFTQYLYHTWIGASILLLLWTLLVWMLKKAFNIPSVLGVLAIIPIAILSITIFHLGYWIFYLKMHGYFFASTLGTILVVSEVWLYRFIPVKYHIRTLFIIIITFISYPLFGCYALCAALIMGIISWRAEIQDKWHCLLDSIAAILSILAIPLIYYNTLYHSTNINDLWFAGIPRFETAERVCTPYYMPYLLLILCLIAFALLYKKHRTITIKRPLAWSILQITIYTIICIFTYLNWYKDKEFHQELKMYRNMESMDWDSVLKTMSEAKTPTRFMWMMNNLALFRLDRQGDEMYHYRYGNKLNVAPFEVRMLQIGGKLLYLNYGQSNFCHRWCIEAGVEFGWRIEYLKSIVTSLLMNGETEAAQKYLHILHHTKYYKIWMPEGIDTMKRLMSEDDQLTSDNMLAEAFLLNHFANRDSQDPVTQEASLMFALQSCNKEVFKKRLQHAIVLQPQRHIPLHCQEALCVYNLSDSFNVDNAIKKNYEAFMSSASQLRGMDMKQAKAAMYERYGNTFFYDYYFNNYQQPQ